ncbi:hypothetical protein ACSBR2_036143 [Camellia fascicularis]
MNGLSIVEIENDNQELIKLCVSETVLPWEIMAIVADILRRTDLGSSCGHEGTTPLLLIGWLLLNLDQHSLQVG